MNQINKIMRTTCGDTTAMGGPREICESCESDELRERLILDTEKVLCQECFNDEKCQAPTCRKIVGDVFCEDHSHYFCVSCKTEDKDGFVIDGLCAECAPRGICESCSFVNLQERLILDTEKVLCQECFNDEKCQAPTCRKIVGDVFCEDHSSYWCSYCLKVSPESFVVEGMCTNCRKFVCDKCTSQKFCDECVWIF